MHLVTLGALGNKLMDNFAAYGFATKDGVCASYSARTSCVVNTTVDPACLGAVDKCAYAILGGFYYTLMVRRIVGSRYLEGCAAPDLED